MCGRGYLYRRAPPLGSAHRLQSGDTQTVPLDPVSRRELRRALGMALALASNPFAVFWGWFSAKPQTRVRQRVYLNADGDVVRNETLEPDQRERTGAAAPWPEVPALKRKVTTRRAAARSRGSDWWRAGLVIFVAVLLLLTFRAVLAEDDVSREECERLLSRRDQLAERICDMRR